MIGTAKGIVEVTCKNKQYGASYLLLLKNVSLNIEGCQENLEQLWIPFNNKEIFKTLYSTQGKEIEVIIKFKKAKTKEIKATLLIDVIDNIELGIDSLKTKIEKEIEPLKVKNEIQIGDVVYTYHFHESNDSIYFKPPMLIYKIDSKSENLESKCFKGGVCDWYEMAGYLSTGNIYRFDNEREFKKFLTLIDAPDINTYCERFRDSKRE